MSKEGKKNELSTTQLIAMGYLAIILVGTALLMLPISTASGQMATFTEAIFTSTTSVCVTGLVVVDTYAYWSVFGQIVILLLIQCGGLGIISLTTLVTLLIGKNISLKSRLLIEDAFNLNTLKGLVKFLKRVVRGTLLMEFIGAIFYASVFIPEFGVKKGLFMAIFNAVSAFCNAGMDIIGNQSLAAYVNNPIINITTMTLIVLGGIGFIVWWDILKVFGMIKKGEIKADVWFSKFNLHTKIVLCTTVFLIVLGAIAIFGLEYSNANTLGELSFGSKVMAAFFQSITTRTAGFFTIAQPGFRDATTLLCMMLMFIGGSPVGTAGGIKTTTAALLLIAAWSVIKGRKEVMIFNRTIPVQNVRKALAVTMCAFIAMIVATMTLLMFEDGAFVDVMFETISAIGTVGLSRNFTPTLNEVGRYIIIILMYFGRVGPVSLAMAMSYKQGKVKSIEFPKEEVAIG